MIQTIVMANPIEGIKANRSPMKGPIINNKFETGNKATR
jgi:hypothetical protein